MSTPKPITEHLADLLRERSARGLEKYGTSIDRGDLNRAEWLQHLLEELLDAAQYVEAAKRQAPCAELPEPMPPTTLDMPLTREQREVEDSFRRGWNSCRATVMLAATQQDERIGAWHLVFDTMLRVRPKVFHNDKTAQQAVCDEIEAMAAALAATPQPLAEPVLPTITAEEAREFQRWKGMDGETAYHLIERHADGWADVGVMMNAWLEANAAKPPAKPEKNCVTCKHSSKDAGAAPCNGCGVAEAWDKWEPTAPTQGDSPGGAP